VNFVKFAKLFLFKSSIFSFSLLYFNTLNGFSGFTIFQDLYYALFDVVDTSIAILFFVMFDQDVSFSYTNKED
jgi:magnesium-transporting ATPase (P-type)